MQLYKNEQEFRDAIVAASNYYHISPSIVGTRCLSPLRKYYDILQNY